MVPKNATSSSSKAGGSSSASSNSADLFNKMNDYVLSRTPDQSASSRFLHQVMRMAVASISQEIGWHTAQLSALDVLSDLAVRYLLQVAKQSKKYTEHYGRTLVNEDDVALGLRDMSIAVPELEEYVQNFDSVVIPKEIPYIPVPRKTDLNFLRPGSAEVLTRPVHVHEYMPPMIFEQPVEEESEAEKDKEVLAAEIPVSEEILIKSEPLEEAQVANGEVAQNEIIPLIVEEPSQVPEVANELVVSEVLPVVITEEEVKTENPPENEVEVPPEENNTNNLLRQVSIVQNDLEESSDDDIEPAASKAASIFATFKSTKKLESASENAALKRVRKMLEEQGHPVREVTSVIMTTSGFLSESREGRLPDLKPPPNLNFFDLTPPPKEQKKPTMKSILKGVKKLEKNRGEFEFEEEMGEGPGLFGVMDKIVSSGDGGNKDIDGTGENGILVDVNKDIPKKKLSKLERKKKKELKAIKKKMKSKSKEGKDKQASLLVKQAKSFQAAAACKELQSSTSTSGMKNKLTIFTKKVKPSKLDASGSPIKKKKKDKKDKLRIKKFKRPLEPMEEEAALMKAPPAPTGTELIESDEDFSNADAGGVVSPVHIRDLAANAASNDGQQLPMIPKKKLKKDKFRDFSSIAVKLKEPVLNLSQHPGIAKSFFRQDKHQEMSAPKSVNLANPKLKISKFGKRPMVPSQRGDEPPIKKKRGRPKKVWGEGGMHMGGGHGMPHGSGPVPLPAAQLASIGKSLMIKEPSLKLNKHLPHQEPPLKMMKIRKEHMEIQDLVPVPPTLTTKPPTISPNKNSMGSAAAMAASAELLKRLPAQPGLIPDRISPVPPVRIPKDLPSSISITPAISSPQKEIVGPSSSRGFPGALPSNVCSSVTITRISMSNQSKLPSQYDDSVTPGIGPPPGLEGPHKRNKLKGVPPPPPLQIPIQAETESGITITPIMMGGSGGGGGGGGAGGGGGGGGGNKEQHRYDHPLPPPPPLQERPAPKHSMLAKLDEELSSTPPSTLSSGSSISKEQRRKEKEKRKEMKKEKKKKAKDKDKSKDKSEKKKKKKDKSGESASGGDNVMDSPVPLPATVPKLTLKLGGHSNTPTPVDSPNPPQVYHEPPMPGPPPLKKLTFKGVVPPPDEPKPLKQKPLQILEDEEDLEVARFAPLVTRPQKPARAAKTHAVAAVAAVSMGASVNQQEIVTFPSNFSRGDPKGDSKRGRGRPPKGGMLPVAPTPPPPPPSTPSGSSGSKQTKSSLTVLETETVGCIIDEHGNKIWICPACGRQDDGSPMIGCDICDDWYHFACMGIDQEPSEEEHWYCPRCLRKQKPEGKKKRK